MEEFNKRVNELMEMHYGVRYLANEMLAELRKLDGEHGVFLMEYFERRAGELGLDG